MLTNTIDDFLQNLSNLVKGKKYVIDIPKKDEFYLFPYFVNSNFNTNLINKTEIEDIFINNIFYLFTG